MGIGLIPPSFRDQSSSLRLNLSPNSKSKVHLGVLFWTPRFLNMDPNVKPPLCLIWKAWHDNELEYISSLIYTTPTCFHLELPWPGLLILFFGSGERETYGLSFLLLIILLKLEWEKEKGIYAFHDDEIEACIKALLRPSMRNCYSHNHVTISYTYCKH